MFKDLLEYIPEEILKIEGMDSEDYVQWSRDYFTPRYDVAGSIDPSANLDGKSPQNFSSDIFKPLMKRISYSHLWDSLNELYGEEEANNCINHAILGDVYFHDITHLFKPYCFALSTANILYQGIPWTRLPNSPPKSFFSFIDQVLQAIIL